MKNIFREYDVRGIADTDLTSDRVWALGRALAELIKKTDPTLSTYVGQDARVSSPRLASALVAGLEAGGIKTRMTELGPTPLLYFSAAQKDAAFPTSSGIMVTGSHNPPEYNGFKMVIGGKTLFGDDIQTLYTSVQGFLAQAPKTEGAIRKPEHSRFNDYISFIKGNIKLSRKVKVVLDAGNGAGGELGVAAYKAIGCEVVDIFCTPDGRFPNHHPDPTVPKNLAHLIAKVKETGAELGIAYDGDADRIGAVTATGQILFGDHLVLYFSRDILRDLPGSTIISEVKSSQFLYDTLEKWGAKPIMWKTGHSLIKAKLKETHAALAGEMSGHMFFDHRFFGFDDAIYSGARLIEGLAARKETLDEFLASLPPAINTPELRVDCADSKKFEVVQQFVALARKKYGANVNDIDGARIKIGTGWGLIRASNTQPVLVMRFEAEDRAKLKMIRDDFAGILKGIDSQIEVPQV